MEYSVTWGDTGTVEASPAAIEERAWFPDQPGSYTINRWQMGLPTTTPSAERANGVYACRKVLAEEVSRLQAYHYQLESDGGKTRLKSRLGRILRYPNPWQSRVDFWLGMMDELLRDGNAYALASRDETGAIAGLTPVRAAHPYVDPETGAVFYGIGLDSSVPHITDREPKFLVPSRDMLHLRLFTPTHWLIGESPLIAAAIAANTGTAITSSTFSIFNQSARPSGYLRHPKRLSPQTRERIREVWTQSYSGAGTGGTAILDEGIEWQPLSMNAVDAEIVGQYKLTIEDIARVFRVPLFMLGSMDKSTFANVEQMTRSFYAGGLGFYLSLIEEELARFFDIGVDQVVEFDVEKGLMRAEFRDRIEGTARAVQGGIYTPNEARRREGLPAAEYGDKPLVQQQMVPLDYAAQQTVSAVPEPVPEPVTEETARIWARKKLRLVV